MPIVEIDDVDDPRLDVYRQLNQTNLTAMSGRFIAESRLLVERLLASSYQVESILAAEQFRAELLATVPPDTTIYLLRKELISAVIGFHFHRGMLACGLREPNPTLDQLLANRTVMDSESGRTIIVCPQIVDPTNLAGVIRNACAFGVDGLILGPQCADPFSRRVVRVSMGTVLQLPIRIADDLIPELDMLYHTFACTRVATVLDDRATPLRSAERPRHLALLFGSEGHGLPQDIIEHCDELVTLPMKRGTDSLNLATSTGIFLYHYSQ
ncbi:MAG: RNA methyltransferase [Planctomycetales bacterium]|nr:RNA methyltransferase [Planctomycetales bacterium]